MIDPITPSQESLLAAALEYHARGCSIIPMAITFDGEGRAGEKKPARKWKPYQTRRATEATLRRWFSGGDPRVNGVAVVFGGVSGGLLARDYDAMAEYQAWADAYPELAATLPTMATKRGRQVFAIAAPGCIEAIRRELGKSSGKGAIKIGQGELRAGVGCYSVLPPSPHPSGIVAYRWLIPPGAEIPTVDVRNCGFFLVGGGERVQSVSHTLTTPPIPNTHSSHVYVSDCAIEAAVTATLPTDVGERHTHIFELARRLKAIPELAGASAAELLPHVRRWHALALPSIGTTAWDATWLDFLGAWNGAKYPAGREALASVLARADAAGPPDVALAFEAPALRRLVGLCRELQRAAGDKPFPLACRAPAEHLDVDHDTIAEWLKALCRAGILGRVSLGDFARHKAAEYRYLAPL